MYLYLVKDTLLYIFNNYNTIKLIWEHFECDSFGHSIFYNSSDSHKALYCISVCLVRLQPFKGWVDTVSLCFRSGVVSQVGVMKLVSNELLPTLFLNANEHSLWQIHAGSDKSPQQSLITESTAERTANVDAHVVQHIMQCSSER